MLSSPRVRWMILPFLATLLAVLCTGCSGAGGSADNPADALDLPSVADAPDADAAPVSDLPETDVGPRCPGETFCPCTLFSDCASGLCVDSMEGSVCSLQCGLGETCPQGWGCESVTVFGETIYGCVPRHPDLCRPCSKDEDCLPRSGTVDRPWRCIDTGTDGSFCGAPCDSASDCPAKPVPFDCVPVPGPGGTVNQCRPLDGPCPCTEKFKDYGYLTGCAVENGFGSCAGQRTCAEACDATTPAAETCNGRDDDCDGDTDEGIPSIACSVTTEWGACPGTAACKGGRQDVCLGPKAAAETCDGHDNDCDGDTDEGFPDSDGDRLPDCLDPDLDGDTVPNETDDCPEVADTDQANNDAAEEDPPAMGDACDPDDDNDGIPDSADVCRKVKDPLQVDTDLDEIGDACDCDADGDGRTNPALLDLQGGACPAPDPATDNCLLVKNGDQADADGDRIGDACDCDVDGDGVDNNNPGCPAVPTADNCRNTANPLQEDTDRDGDGDACDCDIDNDTVMNSNPGCPSAPPDNCPFAKNLDQRDTDLDRQGDACDCDIDGDDVPDANPGCPACGGAGNPACDNCPTVKNPGQESTLGGTVGDACNDDMDDDGVPNARDNCPNTPNRLQGDIDLDKSGDDCDCDIDDDDVGNPGVDRLGAPCPVPPSPDNCPAFGNPTQADLDGDKVGDPCDCDVDGDEDPNPNTGCPNPVPQDCDPVNAEVSHLASEACGNGVDDDCNPVTGDDCAG